MSVIGGDTSDMRAASRIGASAATALAAVVSDVETRLLGSVEMTRTLGDLVDSWRVTFEVLGEEVTGASDFVSNAAAALETTDRGVGLSLVGP